MDWEYPLKVFAFGYGACFTALAVIMCSIFVTRRMIEWIQTPRKKEPQKG